MLELKLNPVKCPYCGAEYLPSELIYPDDIFPKAKDITKNTEGKLLYADSEEPVTEETYCCDYCLKTFSIKTSVSITTEKLTDDFSDDF